MPATCAHPYGADIPYSGNQGEPAPQLGAQVPSTNAQLRSHDTPRAIALQDLHRGTGDVQMFGQPRTTFALGIVPKPETVPSTTWP